MIRHILIVLFFLSANNPLQATSGKSVNKLFCEGSTILKNKDRSVDEHNLAICNFIEIVYLLRSDYDPPYHDIDVKETLISAYFFLGWFGVPDLTEKERENALKNAYKKILETGVDEELLGTREQFAYILLRSLEFASNEQFIKKFYDTDKNFLRVSQPARKKLEYYRAALGR